MAYLDLRDAGAAPLFTAPAAIAAPAPQDGFARAEWQVIVLAQKDGLSSLRAPSRAHRLLEALFGGGFNPRLADPRLEALRRTAVLAWHYGYSVPKSAIKAFLAAGFGQDQLELLLASVAKGRSTRPNGRVAAI